MIGLSALRVKWKGTERVKWKGTERVNRRGSQEGRQWVIEQDRQERVYKNPMGATIRLQEGGM